MHLRIVDRAISTARIGLAATIANMAGWYDDDGNASLLHRLRRVIAGRGRLLVFLGAGLSFGAARFQSRSRFDYDRYDRWWPPISLIWA